MLCGYFSINTTHKDDSKIHDFSNSDTLHCDDSNSKTFDHAHVYNSPSPFTAPSKYKPMHLTKTATSSVSEPKPHLKNQN